MSPYKTQNRASTAKGAFLNLPVPSHISLERLEESVTSFFDRTVPVASLKGWPRTVRTRYVNSIEEAGIIQMWQLLALAEADILRAKGVGKKTVQFIRKYLRKEGLDLQTIPALRTLREEVSWRYWFFVVVQLGRSPTAVSRQIVWNPEWPRQGTSFQELFVYAPGEEASRYAKMVAFCQRRRLEDVFPSESPARILQAVKATGVTNLLEFLALSLTLPPVCPTELSQGRIVLMDAMRKDGIDFV